MSDPFDLARGLVEMLAAWRFSMGFVGGLVIGTGLWLSAPESYVLRVCAVVVGLLCVIAGAAWQWRADARTQGR